MNCSAEAIAKRGVRLVRMELVYLVVRPIVILLIFSNVRGIFAKSKIVVFVIRKEHVSGVAILLRSLRRKVLCVSKSVI